MIKIAVVEDEPDQLGQISNYLKKYETISGNQLLVRTFSDGDELLDDFLPGSYHILLLDVQMKRVDGMTAAKKIRTIDESVVIMFITNIVQYAVKGYSVQALDFIVKPIGYHAFAQKIETAIEQVHRLAKRTVCIKTISGLMIFELDDIVCVEIVSRKLLIHTLKNSYQCNETLQGIEDKLNDDRFYRCHAAFLVNLQHIHQIDKSNILVANKQVPKSRYRHKGLLDALTKYLGK